MKTRHMQHPHTNLRLRLMAWSLLISLFLQSCGPSSIPVVGKATDYIPASTQQLALKRQLADQEMMTQEGHLVSFYEVDGELKAKVQEVHGNFSMVHDLTAYVASDIAPSQIVLLNNNEELQKRMIHVNLPKCDQTGRVFVGQSGLLGGMKKGKGKEKEDEKEKEKESEEKKLDKFDKEGLLLNHDFANFQPNEKGPRLLLSLDGGGIRGVLEAYLLNDLEETLESKIKEHFKDLSAPAPDLRLGECFDLIAGTSTGGIIALAMRMLDSSTNRPKLKMRDILALYEDQGEIIFPSVSAFSGIFGAKFNPQPLERLFQGYFGETTLKDLTKPTLVAAYDVTKEGVHLFTDQKAERKPSENFALKDVARATSAAPTYFPAAKIKDSNGGKHVFVDGGVEANNPTLHAYIEAKERFPESRWHILSLGTGHAHLFASENKDSGGILQWGWGGHIASLLMNSNSNTIQNLTPRIVKSDGNEYIRLQFELDKQVAGLDNASAKNIKFLKGYAKRTIENNHEFLAIKDILLDFYKSRGYYVFHHLVDWACSQLEDKGGEINLSNCYLTERALWEITHALRTANQVQVSHLNLSNNDLSRLSTSSLVYLNQLQGLKFLDLSHTHVGIEALTMLKSAGLTLETLKVCQNPLLQEAKDEQLINCTECYATTYFDPILHLRLGEYHKRGGEEAKAIKLYKDCEDPTTQLALAELYLRKAPDSQEFDTGFKLVQKLADQGYAEAQYVMGRFYEKPDKEVYGYLVANNLLVAGKAELDSEQAGLYKAVYWYKLAAEQQHKNAANALARLYEDRKIVVPISPSQPRDERHQINEALKYYRMAKAAGSTSADKNIKNLEKQLEDITRNK